jgi:hypothetical protein
MFHSFPAPLYLGKLLVPAGLIALLLVSALTPVRSADQKALRHVVLFKFKDTATPDQVNQVEDAFRALPARIDLIKDFEWGTNVSPENLNQGYTHCFFLTFASDQDRDAYLVHPAHREFGILLGPYLDKVTVIDFWSKQ